MGFYVSESHTATKNSSGLVEYKKVRVHFVQLPPTTDDKVCQFSDNMFSPYFDTKVSNIVPDKPELAEKIGSKDKDYFYAFVTEDIHEYGVWINIISKHNKPQFNA